jgi:hypothetical protein
LIYYIIPDQNGVVLYLPVVTIEDLKIKEQRRLRILEKESIIFSSLSPYFRESVVIVFLTMIFLKKRRNNNGQTASTPLLPDSLG